MKGEVVKYVDYSNKHLLRIFNFDSYNVPTPLNFVNHEEWNGFILEHTAREVINTLDDYGYDILGFTEAPWSDYNADKAIVLVDQRDGFMKWCHVMDSDIIEWRCSLTKEDFCEALQEYKESKREEI